MVTAQPSSRPQGGRTAAGAQKEGKRNPDLPQQDPFFLKVNRKVKQCRRHHNKGKLLREQPAAAVNLG